MLMRLLGSLLLSYLMISGPHDAAWADGVAGLYQVTGKSSPYGPYSGQLELRPLGGNSWSVTRIVEYRDFRYEGSRVQEIWRGVAQMNQGRLRVNYRLNVAGYLTRVGPLRRNDSDFSKFVDITTDYLKDNTSEFRVQSSPVYAESITFQDSLGAYPIWSDQRQYIDATGHGGIPLLVKGAMSYAKKLAEFHEHPLVRKFRNHREFKEGRSYLVWDPTDFEFYRKNPDVIRLVNKVMDPINLEEATFRRDAYAYPLDVKAKFFEDDIQKYRLNEFGMVCFATVSPDGRLISQNHDIDSALWTGMYVGAQAMRFLATRDPEALVNVKRSLKGILMLLDITGTNKDFARTVMPYDPKKKYESKWHRGTGPYSNVVWLKGGNNDMLRGITHAILWAGVVLPESDTETRAQLSKAVKQLLRLELLKDKIQNRPMVKGLAAWLSQDKMIREEALKDYKKYNRLFRIIPDDFTFYWRGLADWSGVNLRVVGFINEIVLAEQLGGVKIREGERESLMDTWVKFSPIRHTLLTLATNGFAYQLGTRSSKFRKKASPSQFERIVDFAKWSLREYPMRRSYKTMAYNHLLTPTASLSRYPRLFWKAFRDEVPPAEYFFYGAYTYPLFESTALDSKFVWKDTYFNLDGHATEGYKGSAVDFLYPYWISRMSGLNWD